MNSKQRSENESIEPLLVALGHPVRAQVLATLAGRHASATEIAESIGEPPAKVRYHLRALVKAGLIGWERTEDRRGAREYSWTLKTPQLIEDNQMAQLSPEQIRIATFFGLRLIFNDATAGVRDGAFARRQDHILAWLRPEVDERGWKELAKVLRSALSGIEQVSERAGRRLAKSGQDPVTVSASLLLFDLESSASSETPETSPQWKLSREASPRTSPPGL